VTIQTAKVAKNLTTELGMTPADLNKYLFYSDLQNVDSLNMVFAVNSSLVV
jgi:hypothetical protein